MAKYDVVKDYDWTSSPKGSGMRKKAPRVWVKSYKLISNNIMTAIQGFVNIADAGQDAKSFYDKMYSESTTPEDDFNFPFFSDEIRSFSNEFGETFQNGIGAGAFTAVKGAVEEFTALGNLTDGETLGAAGKQLMKGATWENMKAAMSTVSKGGHPGTYIETPMFYQYGKSDGALQVSFVLANTISPEGPEKNYNLIQRLTYINRPLRVNSIAVDPPRIYQVKVPGQRFIRWAYCDSFSVRMLGTRREINGVIVPEAYEVSMSFVSLTLEHAGFMKEVK